MAAVAEDRHGIRSSIIERIERHGGKVDVRSTPRDGTEIEISDAEMKSAAQSKGQGCEGMSAQQRAGVSRR